MSKTDLTPAQAAALKWSSEHRGVGIVRDENSEVWDGLNEVHQMDPSMVYKIWRGVRGYCLWANPTGLAALRDYEQESA